MNFKFLNDAYEWRTRIFPALIVLLPAISGLYLWIPGARSFVGTAVSAFAAFGLLQLFANIIRDIGRVRGDSLVKTWGGMPTTIMLRHGDATLDSVTKQRYHKFLSDAINTPFPNARSERKNLATADEVYSSAVSWLRENARDKKKFPRVFEGLVNYSFMKNMWAVRWYALAFNGLVIAINIFAVNVTYGGQVTSARPSIMGFTVFSVIFPVLWLFMTKGAVKRAGFEYARALLSTCEKIP